MRTDHCWGYFWRLALLTAPLLSGAAHEFKARSGFYGPRVELRYTKPTLRWEVWSENGPVTAASMQVNGAVVDAHYDPDSRSLLFTPTAPLPLGVNKIHCSVTFAGEYTFQRDWDTKVGTGAVDVLPEPDQAQMEALSRANAYRDRLGLPHFVMDPRLNAAAQAHADYMSRNSCRGHGELASAIGFIAADPASRLESYGWGGSSWEGLAYGRTGAGESIAQLFDAPYHRLPFLQPGVDQFGFGIAAGNSTAEFQAVSQEAVTVSPADGETGVPVSWSTRETPDPLSIHPEAKRDAPLGYPIMIAQFGSGKGGLRLDSATLTDGSGMTVPVFVNSAANDPNLSNAAVLIPAQPLKAGQTYRVAVMGTGIDDKLLSKTWSFRT